MGAEARRTSFDECHELLATQASQLEEHMVEMLRLTDQYREIPDQLKAAMKQVRAAVEEDLAANARTAFEGEVKLWARVAQLQCQHPYSAAAVAAVPPVALVGRPN